MQPENVPEILQFGAKTILEAPPDIWPIIAEASGVEIHASEDLIAALARTKGVTRDHMETYFRALVAGANVQEAHLLAFPQSGQTN
ncbi:MAG TPA: hypothetical protein VN736_23195 [Candidatus Limnocylindrales bacterium]|nr:hypothetical protein [Candidatus Limnocylindrales bacterium]